MNRLPLWLWLFVLSASICVGQDAEEKGFQTEEPRAAEIKFLRAVKTAEDDYKNELSVLQGRLKTRIAEIRESYVKTLAALLKKTTQDGNLDEAIRIRDRMQGVSDIESTIPKTEEELAAAKKRIQDLESAVAEFEAKTRKIDRKSLNAVVGTWRWFSGDDIVIGNSGKVISSNGMQGTVQRKDDSPGTFVFFWQGSVDTLLLSQSGNLLEGKDNRGGRVWAVKLK
jgi:hypothetical protein